MSKSLIITEKPSVSVAIAKAIGGKAVKKDGFIEMDRYYLSWNLGHLFALKQPNEYEELKDKKSNELKVPNRFEYNIDNDKGKKHQFKVLKSLLNSPDVDFIINGGDAGREGELIFRLTYMMSGSKKPVKRLWLSSMEDSAIRKGLQSLKDGKEFDNLYLCGKARQEADWIVGKNMSPLFKGYVGRVASPTLKIVADRDMEIKNFKPEKFYKIVATFKDGTSVSSVETFKDKNEAMSKAQAIKSLVVKEVKTEQKQMFPPHLYSLTDLQKDANKIYGLTAKKTLDTLQDLYERKISTYPRTDSNYLTDDMGEELSAVVNVCKKVFGFNGNNNNIKRNLDTKKVGDHYAIILTKQLSSGYASLDDIHQKLAKLIAVRMLEATGDNYKYEEQTITFAETPNKVNFKMTSKKTIDIGWKAFSKSFKSLATYDKSEDKKEEEVESKIAWKQNQAESVSCKDKEGITTPPKHYNESSLLGAMERAGSKDTDKDAERKGLGTSATRAGILENLIKTGYLQRSKRELTSTDYGREVLGRVSPKIKSPELTSEFENTLLKISQGKSTKNQFIGSIVEMVKGVMEENKDKVFTNNNFSNNTKKKKAFKDLGKCPKCGKPLYPSKFSKTGWCPNCYHANKDKGKK